MNSLTSATEEELKVTIPRWRSAIVHVWTCTSNINTVAEKVHVYTHLKEAAEIKLEGPKDNIGQKDYSTFWHS